MKRIGEIARSRDLPFLYHSDGLLWEVLDELVEEIGVNALQPIEPKAMDIREVKRKYSGRLCLIGNVQVDTLARGTEEQVIEETKELLRNVAPGGGYCLGSSNSVAYYVKVENYRAMLDTVHAFGNYPIEV